MSVDVSCFCDNKILIKGILVICDENINILIQSVLKIFLRIIHEKFISGKANFKMNKFCIISEAESELEQYKKL